MGNWDVFAQFSLLCVSLKFFIMKSLKKSEAKEEVRKKEKKSGKNND